MSGNNNQTPTAVRMHNKGVYGYMEIDFKKAI